MSKIYSLIAGSDAEGEAGEHDRLAWRLTDILTQFNMGEKLSVSALADRYKVHSRTILRDLNNRLAFLPIQKAGGLYSLDPAYLGKITFKDIERFAALAGLKGLFPRLDNQFFRELFDSRLQETLSIHGPSYEDLHLRLDDFRTVQQAIHQRRRLRFQYRKDDAVKTVEAEPYSLVNSNGVWYLAVVESGQPKSYSFGKLHAPHLLDASFNRDGEIVRMLEAEDSIWLNTRKTEVVMTVAPAVASYFKRRKLLAQQRIEKELEDGGLIVSGKFAHPNQIFPTVRYWIPHLRIVSPAEWQEALESGLRAYFAPKSVGVPDCAPDSKGGG